MKLTKIVGIILSIVLTILFIVGCQSTTTTKPTSTTEYTTTTLPSTITDTSTTTQSTPTTQTSETTQPVTPVTTTTSQTTLLLTSHAVDADHANCLLCHAIDSIAPEPADHAGWKNDTCQTCHMPQNLTTTTTTTTTSSTTTTTKTSTTTQPTTTDKGPPTVLSTSPKTGDHEVLIDAIIKINFSKPMNKDVTANSVTISPETEWVISWSDDKQTMFIRPLIVMKFNTFYTVTIHTQAQAEDGQQMAKDYEFSFLSEFTPPE